MTIGAGDGADEGVAAGVDGVVGDVGVAGVVGVGAGRISNVRRRSLPEMASESSGVEEPRRSMMMMRSAPDEPDGSEFCRLTT